MTNFFNLPHQRLVAYQEARSLLACVREAAIAEPRLRDQALRAAISACLNVAEGCGRVAPADKARVYAIARGEASEAGAALDIAVAAGVCRASAAQAGVRHAGALYGLLTGLIRRFSDRIPGRAGE